MLQLKAEVLASTAIKRKKPWTSVFFIGQKKESILLVDKKRCSILFLPSGKTKRKISKVHPHFDKSISWTISENGQYFSFLLESGDIVLWYKDYDLIKWITQPNDKQTDYFKPKIFISNNAENIVIIYDNFIRLVEVQNEDIVKTQKTVLDSKWTDINCKLNSLSSYKECNITCRFSFNTICGDICKASWAYYENNFLNVHTTVLKSTGFATDKIHKKIRIKHWEENIANLNLKVVKHRGAIVSAISRDGRYMVLGTNQKSTKLTKIIFISIEKETVYKVVDLENCGLSYEISGNKSSNFWICGLQWSFQDLCVACALKNGSLFLVSRFGGLISIETSGCSINMGPKPFLLLHPRIALRNEDLADISVISNDDGLKQIFSVSCHPTLPIFLFSDGYMVSVLQFSTSLTNCNFAIQMTNSLSNSLQLNFYPKKQIIDIKNTELYQFERESVGLDDENMGGGYTYLFEKSGNSGEITFPNIDDLNSTIYFQENSITIDDYGSFLKDIWCFSMSFKNDDDDQFLSLWFSTLTEAGIIYLKKLINYGLENIKKAKKYKLAYKQNVLNVFKYFKDLVIFTNLDSIYQNSKQFVIPFVLRCLNEVFLPNLESFSNCVTGLSSVLSCLVFTEKIFFSVYESIPELNGCQVQTNSCKCLPWIDIRDYFFENIKKYDIENSVVLKYYSIFEKLCMKSSALPRSDFNSLLGCNSTAIDLWMQELQTENRTDKEKIKLLHSILYTLIIQDELRAAVELVELLVRQKDLKLATSLCQSDELSIDAFNIILKQYEQPSPIKFIENDPVLFTCRTMARFMAAYFTNSELYLYPPTNPKPLPSLFETEQTSDRTLTIFHSVISTIIRSEGLSELWTPCKVVDYLLICGLLAEAVWFFLKMGDWKNAFTLSFALTERKKRNPEIYNANHLVLPDYLTPEHMLRQHLEPLLKKSKSENIYELNNSDPVVQNISSTLSDHLVCGTICQIETVSWVINKLCVDIEELIKEMNIFIYDGFYLPAPPLYCLQRSEETDCKITNIEIELRKKLSNIIHLLKLMFSSSKTFKHCAAWYSQKIYENIKTHAKYSFNITSTNLTLANLEQKYLSAKHIFRKKIKDNDINSVLESFKKMCTMCWFLDCRDMTNMLLRKKLKLFQELASINVDEQQYNDCKEIYINLILECLNWAVQYATIVNYMNLQEKNEILSVILSLLKELPPSTKTADIFISINFLFENNKELSEAINELLLKEWQLVNLNLRNNKITLSVYYHQELGRTSNKRCNQFEFEPDFLQFLDTLFAVGFEKYLIENDDSKFPLLLPFYDKLEKIEILSTSHKVATALFKKQHFSDSVPNSARDDSVCSTPRVNSGGSIKKNIQVGLFRSKYVNDNYLKECAKLDSPRTFGHSDLYSGLSPKSSPLDTPQSIDSKPMSSNTSDVLSRNIIAYSQLEKFEFGENFEHLELKLNWLMRWTSRHHIIVDGEEEKFSVRLKIHPKMIIYALWAIDSPAKEIVDDLPFMKTQEFLPSGDYRNIVAYPVERINPASVEANGDGFANHQFYNTPDSNINDDDLTEVSALNTARTNFSDFTELGENEKRYMTEEYVSQFMHSKDSGSDALSSESTRKDLSQSRGIKVKRGIRHPLPKKKKSDKTNTAVKNALEMILGVEKDESDDIPNSSRTISSIRSISTDDFSSVAKMQLESADDVEEEIENEKLSPEMLPFNDEHKINRNDVKRTKNKTFEIPPIEKNKRNHVPNVNFNEQTQFPNTLQDAWTTSQTQPNINSSNFTNQMQNIMRSEMARFMQTQQQSLFMMMNLLQNQSQQLFQPVLQTQNQTAVVEQQTQTETNSKIEDEPLKIEDLENSEIIEKSVKKSVISIKNALNELNLLKNKNFESRPVVNLLSISGQNMNVTSSAEKPFQNVMNRLTEFNKNMMSTAIKPNFLKIPAEKEQDAFSKQNETFTSSFPKINFTGGKSIINTTKQNRSFSGPLPLLKLNIDEHKTFQNIEDSKGSIRLVSIDEMNSYEKQKQVAEDLKFQRLHSGRIELLKKFQTENDDSRTHVDNITPLLPKENRLENKETVETASLKNSTFENKFNENEELIIEQSDNENSHSIKILDGTGYSDSEFDESPETESEEEPSLKLELSENIEILQKGEEKAIQTEYNLNSGYALTPGLFDKLVTEEEMQKPDLTFAEAQYRTVMQLQQMSKNNEVVNGEGIVPPDVFLNLKFDEDKKGYINVIDIGTDVIKEIQQDVNTESVTKKEFRHQETDPIESVEKFKPVVKFQDEDKERCSDEITLKMFADENTTTSGLWESDSISKLARNKSKNQIKKRLLQMDERLQAIGVMSRNIEDEFQISRNVLKTLTTYTNDGVKDEEKEHVLQQTDEEIGETFNKLVDKYSARYPENKNKSFDDNYSSKTDQNNDININDLSSSFETQGILKDIFENDENKLEKMQTSKTNDGNNQSLIEKVRLRKWIKQKKIERHEQYKTMRKQLFENEKRPFKSQQSSLKKQEDTSKERTLEFTYKRLADADNILHSLLTDKVPKVSEIQKNITEKKFPVDMPPSENNLDEFKENNRNAIDNYLKPVYEYDPIKGRAVKRVTSIGTLISDEKFHDRLKKKQQEIIIKEREEELMRQIAQDERRKEAISSVKFNVNEPKNQPDQTKFKIVESYTDIVKLQRPEVTKPRENIQPNLYKQPIERVTVEKKDSATLIKKSKIEERSVPRNVKSYTERLAEMKANSKPRRIRATKYKSVSSTSGTSLTTNQSRKSSRPLKPAKTYVEQLKSLQPDHSIKSQANRKPVLLRHPIKAKKPSHPTKTYAQQLQELQRPRQAINTRPRPYKSPYVDGNESDESRWSARSDVQLAKHLIYSGDTSGLSEVNDNYLENIEDLRTIESQSVVSIIDWENVENLINIHNENNN